MSIDINKLVDSIKDISEIYSVSQERIAEILEEAIQKTFNKQLPDCILNVKVDLESKSITLNRVYKVIEDAKDGEYDDFNEITLTEASKYGSYNIGDECLIPYDLNDKKNFSQQQINQTSQIFRQKLNEINNIKIFDLWSPRIGEIITAEVEKYDSRGRFYTINLNDGNFGFLSNKESIPNENLIPGKKYKFLIKDVKQQSKGWPIILSRADALFVQKLMTIEVPEIQSGEVIVNKIERIAGFKTKIAVSSNNTNYEPTGVCIGSRGTRIKAISEQVMNERIEVIKYIEDPKTFLISLAGPRNIIGLQWNEGNQEGDKPHVILVVHDHSLPIVIGKKGNNINLIAKMVGCSIDVNTLEQAHNANIRFEQIDAYKYETHESRQVLDKNINKSNDDLLSEIEELSSEELADIYGVDLTNSSSEEPTSTPKPTVKSEKTENKEIIDDVEVEDDLANAFSDEIANVLDEESKK